METVNVDEPSKLEDSQEFFEKVVKKCQVYRREVEKNNLKKCDLYDSLERDFGDREKALKMAEIQRSEINSQIENRSHSKQLN